MLTKEQINELDRASRAHPKAGVRVKALAVRAVANGVSRVEVGKIVNTSAYSVGQWVLAYSRGGLQALEIGKGRGRVAQVDIKELEEYVRQSPRNFGINRTRWTLSLLAEKVPSLKGLGVSSIWYALQRAGISYKRGTPYLHSPDPDYIKKKDVSKNSLNKRGKPRKS